MNGELQLKLGIFIVECLRDEYESMVLYSDVISYRQVLPISLGVAANAAVIAPGENEPITVSADRAVGFAVHICDGYAIEGDAVRDSADLEAYGRKGVVHCHCDGAARCVSFVVAHPEKYVFLGLGVFICQSSASLVDLVAECTLACTRAWSCQGRGEVELP